VLLLLLMLLLLPASLLERWLTAAVAGELHNMHCSGCWCLQLLLLLLSASMLAGDQGLYLQGANKVI
jgi:hypothetical protein